MTSMIRCLVLTSIVLTSLSLTGVLLALPGHELQYTAGAVEVPTGAYQASGLRSAIDRRFRSYGLLNYLTIVDDFGMAQPRGRSFQLDPLRTFLTGVLLTALWAGVGWTFCRCCSTAAQAVADFPTNVGPASR
jgi:hypothetical protein